MPLCAPSVQNGLGVDTVSLAPQRPAFDDWNKAAFASAGDTCKTILTLTTGILALTISFMTDVAKGATSSELWLLRASWLFFLLSAVFGILTLQALTGSLSPSGQRRPGEKDVGSEQKTPSVYSQNIAAPAIKQNIMFGVGVLLFIIFGALSVSAPKSQPTVEVTCSQHSSICQVTK